MPSIHYALRSTLFRRDDDDDEFDDDYESFWWTDTGVIVKYCIFLFIFLVIFGWIIGGFIHARRRLNRGQPPLRYHKWLVPRSHRNPRPQNQFSFYQQGQGQGQAYGMQAYPEPPPLYTQDAPPAYQPPPGATKANPQQEIYPSQSPAGPSNQADAPELPQRPTPAPQARAWARTLFRRT